MNRSRWPSTHRTVVQQTCGGGRTFSTKEKRQGCTVGTAEVKIYVKFSFKQDPLVQYLQNPAKCIKTSPPQANFLIFSEF